jgi:arginyl-tRNA synthetase
MSEDMTSAATDTAAGLENLLASLSLAQPTPTISGATILCNPLDIYRTYLAESLVRLTNCDPKVAFEAITPSNDASNGDAVVILPRLKLPTRTMNPKELGFDIIRRVSWA